MLELYLESCLNNKSMTYHFFSQIKLAIASNLTSLTAIKCLTKLINYIFLHNIGFLCYAIDDVGSYSLKQFVSNVLSNERW